MFDLLHYYKYFIHIIFRALVRCFLNFLKNLMRGFVFQVDNPASNRYQYSAFSVEYRFERTAHNGQYLVAALRTFGNI